MINVVMISKKDFAGSGNRIAEAVNLYSNGVNIRLITAKRNIFHYNVDYCLDSVKKPFLQEIINNADIIHFKGDDLPVKNWYGLKIPNVPVILTVGGSGFRRHANDCRINLAWHELNNYIQLSDFRTTITADLNYKEFDAIYSPHCLDTLSQKNYFELKEIPIIQHSPSNRGKKGTNNIILPAIQILKSKGYNFTFELLENLSNKKCLERKKNATIFIDQICETGHFGISAIESMQYGIPTICHISENSIKQSNGILENCPIINVDISINSLVDKLEYLLTKADLKAISNETKLYTDTYHSYLFAANFWENIYKKIYAQNINRIQSAKASEFLSKKDYFLNINEMETVKIRIISAKLGKINEVRETSITKANEFIRKGYAIKFIPDVKKEVEKPDFDYKEAEIVAKTKELILPETKTKEIGKKGRDRKRKE